MKTKPYLVLTITLLSTLSWAQETVLEVLPLFNRPASEVQPLLESLLEKSDRIIADGHNLIVRTTPDRLTDIKELVNQLDLPANNLIITVLQSRIATADELNAEARAHLETQSDDPLRLGGRIAAHVYQTQGQYSDERRQSIRTLEGNTAYIKSGNIHPVESVTINHFGYGYPVLSSQTELIDASTGFAVTPHLAGNHVILDISPWSDTMDAHGQLNTQDAHSTLTVKLGEWIELGGIHETGNSGSYGTLARIRQTHQNRLNMLIKVDKTQ